MRLAHLFLALCIVAVALCYPAEPVTGYSLGNFGISGSISPNGRLFADVQVNPSQWGQNIVSVGQGSFQISTSQTTLSDFEIPKSEMTRTFPEYSATWHSPLICGGVSIQVDAFAPISPHDSSLGFLPVLAVKLSATLTNTCSFTLAYQFEVSAAYAESPVQISQNYAAIGPMFIAVPIATGGGGGAAQPNYGIENNTTMFANVTLAGSAGQLVTATFVIGYYDTNGYYTDIYPSISSLVSSLSTALPTLQREHAEFIQAIPSTGAADVDAYVRWYLSAGVLLTKGLKTKQVITMGYVEFNQRDSFWASWMHVIMWPDLDAQMLREAAAAQMPSGKIPTCILPEIERDDDIDITAYFVIRAVRHFDWNRDRALAQELWHSLQAAVNYLSSLCIHGAPQQRNFWADWKDVPEVTGRLYAPHFVLCYVAAVQHMARLAVELGKDVEAVMYEALAIKAKHFAESDYATGGLWADTHYRDRWSSGTGYNTTYILADQSVGVFLGAVGNVTRALSVMKTLLSNSEGECGIRETFPYIDGWAQPGDYHNGGIWPWLSFVDIANRFAFGHSTDAERLIRNLGICGLERSNAFTPAEYLQGTTGLNSGHMIQAWDAAAYAAILKGAFGWTRLDDQTYQLRLALDSERLFSARLPLAASSGRGYVGIERRNEFNGDVELYFVHEDQEANVSVQVYVEQQENKPVVVKLGYHELLRIPLTCLLI